MAEHKVSRLFDPFEIYKQAEVFHRSAVTLWKADPYDFVAAYCVCGAFALELYFKCLITLDGRKASGHVLLDLFHDLAPADQTAIRNGFIAEVVRSEGMLMFQVLAATKSPALDFDACLAASSEAFQRFRYVYEPDLAKGAAWRGPHINLAARLWIVQLHPEWKDAHVGLVSPPAPPPTSPSQ